MKTSFLVAVTAAMFLTGCGHNSSTSPTSSAPATNNAVANAPAPAPGGYLGALGQAQQSSEKRIDTAYLTQDIQQFEASEGRFPTNLQELIPNYIAQIPDVPPGYKLNYDPNSGTVTVVKQ